MAVDKIHLRKLLQMFYAKPSKQTSLLREEIRREIKKELKEESAGGDFHTAFWADAKAHIAGKLDLRDKSKDRAEKNKTRKRLYPLLANGFLGVWEERVRWRNEKFQFHPRSAKGQLFLSELGATVKIENVLSVKTWDGSDRAIYPYFSEEPVLPIEGVRLGFWALREALPQFRIEDLRIVDVLRSSYYRPADAPLQGNERVLFAHKYDAVLTEWRRLRQEYP